MAAFLKLYESRPNKEGKYIIRIGVGYGTNLYLSTGIAVDKKDWDAKTCQYTGKGAKVINDTLTAILTRINATILELRASGSFTALAKSKLKAILTGKVDSTSDKSDTLGGLFEKVITLKNKRNAEIFQSTLKKLTDWRNDIYTIKFGAITKMWLNEFYASMGDLAVNTKSIHMRNLRNVINYAIDEGLTQNYPFRNYRIPSEETPMRVLSIEQLRELKEKDLKNKYDREHRDIFMLMFYLIGINIIDLSRLTADNIIDGRIEYRRAKTNKLYSIKIEPEAQSIIDRYRGEKHLLCMFDRYNDYKGYAEHLNNAIGRILFKGVTSYWARYSWATIAAELDIPKDTISESLGHEYGSRITGIYIKYSRDKIDAANRKVIDYLNF